MNNPLTLFDEIINDLVLSTQDMDKFYKTFYGTFSKDANQASENNNFITTSLKTLLSSLELDLQLNLNYYNHLKNIEASEWDAPIWNQQIADWLINEYNFTVFQESTNTYNYDSLLERIIQYSLLSDPEGKDYIVMMVHAGEGYDARCGYSPALIYKVDDIDYLDFLIDSVYVYINEKTSVDVHFGEVYLNDSKGENTYIGTLGELEDCLDILRENNTKIEVMDFEY